VRHAIFTHETPQVKMTTEEEIQQKIKTWWASRRRKYNMGLLLAGILAFILYAILGMTLIAPYDNEFEITLFTTFFQGVGYLLMIGIANLFYGLGPYVDRRYNKKDDQIFRQRLFNLGYWGSFALPFLIPLFILISYFVEFA
jgi:hypothetical protein